jgi:hypothetical protein
MSRLDLGCVRIPIKFFEDHYARGLPTPDVYHSTKAHYWIRRDDPALAELVDDAKHYADRDGPDGAPWLIPAAKALLKALDAE